LTKPAGSLRAEAERNLALLGYGLLGVSIFFAGVTAVVAVGIAYALHDAATDDLSRHFRFQIRIFWIGVGFIALTLVAGLVAAFGAVGNLLHQAAPTDVVTEIVVFGRQFDLSGLRITPLVVVAAGASAGAGLLGALWMLIAPTAGFIRLATSRRMGETARP
jgi:uncharacterized membrane protein